MDEYVKCGGEINLSFTTTVFLWKYFPNMYVLYTDCINLCYGMYWGTLFQYSTTLLIPRQCICTNIKTFNSYF